MTKLYFNSEQVYNGYLKVNSCGKQWLTDHNYDTIKEKGRVDFSIHYILTGTGYSESDGITSPIPEGSLVLYFPKVRHHYSFKKEDSTVMMWSHFSGTACGLLDDLLSSVPVIIKIQDRKQFESVFEKMIVAHYKKTTYSNSICEGYMIVLLSLIAQSSLLKEEKSTKVRNENLELVLSLMHDKYDKAIDIKKYAQICCLSEDHFIRVFKAYTGLPPYHYQLKIRIDRAREMLENTSISVSECAEVVGFSDISYFSRVFKKFTKHPPSYYKKL